MEAELFIGRTAVGGRAIGFEMCGRSSEVDISDGPVSSPLWTEGCEAVNIGRGSSLVDADMVGMDGARRVGEVLAACESTTWSDRVASSTTDGPSDVVF
jgi:hypothetical protein